ncbi:MAG: hypothetical protein ACAH95_15320, partial [Fimbriimonas sp.]
MMPGLLFLLPFALLQDPVIEPVTDQALQKKITISLRGQPINDAVRDVGKAAGVICAAVQNLWDLKVTVLCKDEPAGPVMKQLAEVLGAEWTKDGDTYRLGFERTAQQQRLAYEQAEARLMRDRIEKGLVPYTHLASVNRNAPKPSAELKAKIAALSKDPTALQFGEMLGSMNSSQVAAFWRGEVQTYLPPAGPPPPESSVAFPDEMRRVVARFDPFLASLDRMPGRDPALQTNALVLYERPPDALANMPFAKDVISWTADGNIPAEDERFNRSVQSPTIVRSDFFVRKPVLDDYLESFFRSTGIAVVGDSFSVSELARAPAGNVKAWIN